MSRKYGGGGVSFPPKEIKITNGELGQKYQFYNFLSDLFLFSAISAQIETM